MVREATTSPAPARYRPPQFLVALVFLIVLVTVVGGILAWRSRNDGHITRWQDLQKLPEASLYYPGSIRLSSGGSDYDVSILAILNTTYYQTLSVDADAATIMRFYQSKLTTQGWGAATVSSTTEESAAYGWRKGQLLFRLSFPKPITQTSTSQTSKEALPAQYSIVIFADHNYVPSKTP